MVTGNQVVVIGDVARQVILVPAEKRKDRFTNHSHWMGAPLLQSMIAEAIQAPGSKKKRDACWPDYQLILGKSDDKSSPLCRPCDEFIAVLGAYPQRSRDGDDKKVMRLAQDFRTSPRMDKGKAVSPSLNAMFDRLGSDRDTQAMLSAHTEKIILVAYDRGLTFRNHVASFESWFACLNDDDTLIYAVEDELTPPQLDRSRNAPGNLPPDKALEESIRRLVGGSRRVILVVAAEALRRSGLGIAEFGSIEQAIQDVVSQLDDEPLRSLRQYCRELIVVFKETAVLRLKLTSQQCDRVQGSVHFCPNWDRIAQVDPRQYGSMPAKMSIVVAALVRCLHAEPSAPGCDLDAGLRLSVLAFNAFTERGFEDIERPFAAIEGVLSSDTIRQLKDGIAKKRRELLVSSLTFGISKSECKAGRERERAVLGGSRVAKEAARVRGSSWTRLSPIIENLDSQEFDRLIYRIVREGVDEVFRDDRADKSKGLWFPPATIRCPYAEFGKYKTVDEREASSYLDLAKLIYKYLQHRSWDKPLSIAVFGPPGSGKSFAVKEILKFASPGSAKKEPLTFNLAQFSSVDQLTDAFHQVQDRALAEEEVPLVIFDEFDTAFRGGDADGELGWLKYLLAPMQDGLFRGGAQDYRVGRAIFLFSGGVAHSFEGFVDLLATDEKKRRNVKLPDFISRLRGHLTVSDVNEHALEDATNREKVVKVKRAMLLRSLLKVHAKPIFGPGSSDKDSVANIQPSVIDHFVHEWKYTHGVRSMEAVIQASRWVSDMYAESSLPSSSQLETHVSLWYPDRDPVREMQRRKQAEVLRCRLQARRRSNGMRAT